MEASPLTQQSRPDIFKPKIVQLYEDLFQVRYRFNPEQALKPVTLIIHWQTSEYAEPSEGFWREFFLLAPDRVQLNSILEQLSPDATLNSQVCDRFFSLFRRETRTNDWQAQTQQLFSRAVRQAAGGSSPTDTFALEVRSNSTTYAMEFWHSNKPCVDFDYVFGMYLEKEVHES